MRITIQHSTRYTYGGQANYSIQVLRLTPPSFDGQRVLHWNLTVPGAVVEACAPDACGNEVHLVTVNAAHSEIVIEAAGEIDVEDLNGVVTGLLDPCPTQVFLRRTRRTASDPQIEALARSVAGDSPIDRLHAISAAVRARIEYEIGATDAQTTASEALLRGKGVCQDYAHAFISCARHLNIPARYVTGYLLTSEESVSEAHHAWAEAWVDGLGWVGFDVANGICPTERYARLACGLDAGYAAPVRGSRRGGDTEALDVNVLVEQNPQQ